MARKRNWSRAHAARLLWRAGFGGTPKEIDYWARRGKRETIDWLIRGGRGPHGAKRMVGHAPRVGTTLDPFNEWGHDQLWWLDKMVRSQRPLVEKMTLFWHDHFATRDADTPLMLAQNNKLRKGALGSFPSLLTAVTLDPAMQEFLSLVNSNKRAPNENYARELLELFTLGAGNGYTETDVREAARALTGFRGTASNGKPLTVYFDATRWDAGNKTLLGKTGAWGYKDVLRIAVASPKHGPFLVEKLWSYFIPEPLSSATRKRLARVYVKSGHKIAPVVREILEHPALYSHLEDPRMVKWPVVHIAGTLRSAGKGIDTDAWTWISAEMGQQLFNPPSVAGWDTGTAWMSTATMRARFLCASYLVSKPPLKVTKNSIPTSWSSSKHIAKARSATGSPWTSDATDRELKRMAKEFLSAGRGRGDKLQPWQAEITQSALRHLLLAGPDASLH
ncbi:MAG TPA: DUF1800 domain-containing protein [Baekduia sp.]|nr:DUF1800 domain-containing protein [Baekduia sp.]